MCMNLSLFILFYSVPVFIASLQSLFQFFKVEDDMIEFSQDFGDVEVCDSEDVRNTIFIINGQNLFFFGIFVYSFVHFYLLQQNCCSIVEEEKEIEDYLSNSLLVLFFGGVLRTAVAFSTIPIIEGTKGDCFKTETAFEIFFDSLERISFMEKMFLYTFWVVLFIILCSLTFRLKRKDITCS